MKNKNFIIQSLLLNILISIPIICLGQDLACSSSSYENIDIDKKYTTKQDRIIFLKISENKIFAEISSSRTKSTFKNVYNIVGNFKQDYLAYEELKDKSSPLTSTLSISLEKMIATFVVFNSTGVSVTMLKCISR